MGVEFWDLADGEHASMRIGLAILCLFVVVVPGCNADKPEATYEGKLTSQWITLSRDRAPSTRLQAVRALTAIGLQDEEVEHALARMVDDEDRAVRRALAPTLVPRLESQGADALDAGDDVAAMETFRRSLSLNSNSVDSHAGLGEAYLRMGKSKEAYWEFSEVVRLDPDNQGARQRLEELQREAERQQP